MVNPRLAAIAAQVIPGKPMADIGTDHGAIPTGLLAAGRVPSAIGVDVASGPLAGAAARGRAWLGRGLELRLADGLQGLAAGEVATVVIAGMGGLRVIRLLREGAAIARTVERLVLQPNDHAPELRQALASLELALIDEELCWDRGHAYPILVVAPGTSPHPLDPADLRLGPFLRRRGAATWRRWAREELDRLEGALALARGRARDPRVVARLEGELGLLRQALAEAPSGI